MGEKRQKTAQEQRYQQRVNEKMPRSKTVSQCVRAFIAGGLICCIGQAVRVFGETTLHLDAEGVAALTAIVMVFLGATLTGFGVYDKIGTWAGALLCRLQALQTQSYLLQWSLSGKDSSLAPRQKCLPSRGRCLFMA